MTHQHKDKRKSAVKCQIYKKTPKHQNIQSCGPFLHQYTQQKCRQLRQLMNAGAYFEIAILQIPKKMHNIKGKVKVMLICIVSIHETSVRHSGIARIAKGYQFYLHTLRFIRMPYMSLPSQPQLVLIYRPWRDGRLSRP